MKTEQEQIKAIKQIIDERVETTLGQVQGRHGNVIKTVDTVIIAKDIVDAGYGDISEYKAEIERLKEEKKQAQIDMLNRVMTYINDKVENDYGDMSDSVQYLTINIDDFDDFIDELIKEVENEQKD